MKRILIALLIVTAGLTALRALQLNTTRLRQELSTATCAWQSQTQQLAQVHLQTQHLAQRLEEIQSTLPTTTPRSHLTPLAEKILAGADLNALSAEEREQLRAELDCHWNTTGDFLIVSKKSLESIDFRAVESGTLTDAARAALAMTAQEQSGLDALMQRLTQSHQGWAKDHLQREIPTGDVVAKYSLPVDVEFSQSLSNQFTGGIYTALGPERGELFQGHSRNWMDALGMSSGPGSAYANSPTTMTIERYSPQSDQLRYTLQRANSQMQTSVTRWQPFPEEFRAAFPGGWEELAQREGFELPKDFRRK